MWNLTAKFDPLTGLKIATRIDTTTHTTTRRLTRNGPVLGCRTYGSVRVRRK
jgi:hypothetical protein